MNVIKILLSAGANVNNRSQWSISPLISALNIDLCVDEGLRYQGTVACLIDSGANVNCRDADGMTPLMYAASRFEYGVGLIQLLMKAGASPYSIDGEGYTALHHACVAKHKVVVEYLLDIAPDLLLL